MTERPKPDWLLALEREIAKPGKSQNKVAADLRVSPAYVSKARRGTDPRAERLVEERVRAVLLDAKVQCPAAGEIALSMCLDTQGKPFMNTNPLRAEMYQACHGGTCPHSKVGGAK
ncbi:MAG: hypothetical protein AUJ55_07075 [Proteobacteria bacterium CG1_02_64_396]|nr:MAG: hypothetical protein AUJ55_07075 [Proteobacteria bacterium CG1_02_64_396]